MSASKAIVFIVHLPLLNAIVYILSEKRGRHKVDRPIKRSSMTSAATPTMAWCHRLLSTSQAVLTCASRNRSTWRWSDVVWNTAHPNKKHHLSHRKHWFPVHTYGVQRESYLRCVDVSICCKSTFQDQKPNLAFDKNTYSAGNLSVAITIGDRDRNHSVRFDTICSSPELQDRQGGHGGGEAPLYHKRLLA